VLEEARASGQDFQQSLKGVPRLQRELQQCRLPHGCRLEASQVSPAQLFLSMDVAEGPYTPASLTFWIKVFEDFPAEGSFSIRATRKIFHPCVDACTGAIEVPEEALDSGREGLQLRSLVLAVRDLIVNPPGAPVLNSHAATLLQTDHDEFRRVVRLTLNGGDYAGARFDRVLNPSTMGRLDSKEDPLDGKAISQKVRVDLMELEAMKERFKVQASEVQQLNLGLIDDESMGT